MTAFSCIPKVSKCCYIMSMPVGCVLICFICLLFDDFFSNQNHLIGRCRGFNNPDFYKQAYKDGESRQQTIDMMRVPVGLIAGCLLMIGVVKKNVYFTRGWILIMVVNIFVHTIGYVLNIVHRTDYLIVMIINIALVLYFIVVVNSADEDV